MCDKIVSKEPFMLKYGLDKYKTQEICDELVDSYLLALKFLTDWFVTSKMIKKLHNAVFSNDGVVFGDIDSDTVTFYSNDIGLSNISLNNINPDDNNFDDYDPKTIIILY